MSNAFSCYFWGLVFISVAGHEVYYNGFMVFGGGLMCAGATIGMIRYLEGRK